MKFDIAVMAWGDGWSDCWSRMTNTGGIVLLEETSHLEVGTSKTVQTVFMIMISDTFPKMRTVAVGVSR